MSKAWSEVSKTIHDFGLVEPVYTTTEISKITGFSNQSFERWHRSGDFVSKIYVYNNRNYRYYTDDQLNWFYTSDLYLKSKRIVNMDIIGQRFGKLFVSDYSESAKNKGYYGSYDCICDCGNTVVIPRVDLINGKKKSCGCRFIDISGKKFGRWTVIELSHIKTTPSGFNVFYYKCKCDCGEIRNVTRRSLVSNKSYSCGCFKDEHSMSKSEVQVMVYLENNGFVRYETSPMFYSMYKSFDDLLGLGGGRLSYDFYVNYKGVEYLIECQGGQHYYPVELWGGETVFERQLEHDRLKRCYADNHNYKLIVVGENMISYDDIKKLLDEQLI